MRNPMEHLHADPNAHDLYLQWHAGNFIAPDAIVAIVPFRHHTSTPWHDHDFFELAVIASGHGVHESDDGIMALQAGAAMLLPPGASHEYRSCQNMLVYNCLFRAELVDAELMWARRDRLLGPLFDPGRSQTEGMPRTFVQLAPNEVRQVREILEPIRMGEAPTRTAQLARLLLALDVIARAAAAARPVDVVPETPSSVTDAIELMSQDLAFPWTLEALSQRIFVGRFHLARSFARCVGEPPMQHLARLRAERAAAMLSNTDLPIAVIGAKVGWPDPAYFSRRFRAAFGMSPRAYRQQRSDAPGAVLRGVNPVQELVNVGQVGV
jgi:AraC family L-rhamnose operon transcriptional activator RhaR